MTYLLDVPVEGGGRLLVRASEDELPGGLELAALRPGEVVARVEKSLEQAPRPGPDHWAAGPRQPAAARAHARRAVAAAPLRAGRPVHRQRRGRAPGEVPNQYQLVTVGPDGFTRHARQYASGQRRWIGDTRVSATGSD